VIAVTRRSKPLVRLRRKDNLIKAAQQAGVAGHAWNTRLVDGQWVPTFPNAHYLFGRREWEHWSQEIGSHFDGDVPSLVANTVLEAGVVYQDSILPIVKAGMHELVDSNHRLSDEIELEPTPGHTPGHVSVRISSRGYHAIISGDLMHHPIQCALPDVSSNFDFSVVQAIETRRKFLNRYSNQPVLVLGTHFAWPTAGRIVTHENAWRFSVLNDFWDSVVVARGPILRFCLVVVKGSSVRRPAAFGSRTDAFRI